MLIKKYNIHESVWVINCSSCQHPFSRRISVTLTEEKIVMAAIAFLLREGLLEHQCGRAVDETLLPGVEVLDYAQVAKVQIKRLKPVVRFIMDRKLPDVTETFVVATLKRAGLRLPRARTQFR
jgi:hypothetical protein